MCHHHGMTSSEQPESSVIHHQMVFTGTAIFTIRLLQTLLPVEKVSEHMAVPFLDINKPCHRGHMAVSFMVIIKTNESVKHTRSRCERVNCSVKL